MARRVLERPAVVATADAAPAHPSSEYTRCSHARSADGLIGSRAKRRGQPNSNQQCAIAHRDALRAISLIHTAAQGGCWDLGLSRRADRGGARCAYAVTCVRDRRAPRPARAADDPWVPHRPAARDNRPRDARTHAAPYRLRRVGHGGAVSLPALRDGPVHSCSLRGGHARAGESALWVRLRCQGLALARSAFHFGAAPCTSFFFISRLPCVFHPNLWRDCAAISAYMHGRDFDGGPPATSRGRPS